MVRSAYDAITWETELLFWPDVGAVDVWRFSIDRLSDSASHGLAWLDEIERRRSERFVCESARSTFLAARYALRVLLARYMRTEPVMLRFEYNAYGKPQLTQTESGERLCFNLSHSGNDLLMGFARCEIGIDIQAPVREHILNGLKACLAPKEAAELSRLATSESRAALLLGCWSRKEAVLKAIGMGVSLNPQRISVPTSATCADVPILVPGHGRWWLSSLNVGTGVHAAVAAAAPLAKICARGAGS